MAFRNDWQLSNSFRQPTCHNSGLIYLWIIWLFARTLILFDSILILCCACHHVTWQSQVDLCQNLRPQSVEHTSLGLWLTTYTCRTRGRFVFSFETGGRCFVACVTCTTTELSIEISSRRIIWYLGTNSTWHRHPTFIHVIGWIRKVFFAEGCFLRCCLCRFRIRETWRSWSLQTLGLLVYSRKARLEHFYAEIWSRTSTGMCWTQTLDSLDLR